MPGGRPRKNPEHGLPPRVYLRSGAFYFVTRDNRWLRLGSDLDSAKKQAAKLLEGDLPTGSLGYWLDEWLKELDKRVKAGDLAPRTKADYTQNVDELKPFFGRMDPAVVRPTDVARYLDLGRDADRAVRANREKSALSACYSWLVRRGVVDANPCKGVARNSESARERYISDDEWHRVYDLASVQVRCAMLLIYRTLQRPGDVVKWRESDLRRSDDGVVLEFRQSKTGKLLRLDLPADVVQAIAAAQAAASWPAGTKDQDKPLLPTLGGRHYTDAGISSNYRKTIEAAGVEDMTPYDAKAKGASDMFVDGVPLETIQQLCGHESVTTTERYVRAHSSAVMQANKRVLKRSGTSKS